MRSHAQYRGSIESRNLPAFAAVSATHFAGTALTHVPSAIIIFLTELRSVSVRGTPMKKADNLPRVVTLAALGFTFALTPGVISGQALTDPNLSFSQKLALLRDATASGALVATMSVGDGPDTNVPMQHGDQAFNNFSNGGVKG
jgi:hypothetical protein